MKRTYKYRAYPTLTQSRALHTQIDEACRLYNAALQERKESWATHRVGVTLYSQSLQLKEIREAGNLGIPHFDASKEVLRRVDRAFSVFFRRVKAGEKNPGYPRFRSHNRYDSITFPQYPSGAKIRPTGRLYIQGVGEIKIRWHRKIPIDATIKTLTAKREAGKWFVCFSVEIPDPNKAPELSSAVGIDVGLTTFAVMSDEKEVANPRYYRHAERRLKLVQRKISRRNKYSNRRAKARQELARAHVHVANQRRDFHHKTALGLVREYGLIAIEDLNIKRLASGMLAKSVHDAGWGQFISILTDKAECAGRKLIRVNPSGTTQICSSCGEHVPKSLDDRWHLCSCGLSMSRDLNAALNILHLAQGLGRSLQELTREVTPCVS